MRKHKQGARHHIIGAILIFLIGGLLAGFLLCPPCFKDFNLGIRIFVFSGLQWMLLWKGNELIYIYLDQRISWLENPIKRLLLGIGCMVVYTFGIVALLIYVFSFDVFRTSLDENFFSEVMKSGFISVIIASLISLFLTSRGFLLSWRQAAINIEKVQKESVKMQYEALKNQVDPHFLFNSLNALSSLVHEYPDKAVDFINRLSDVYRYVLDSKNKEVISLKEEVKFVKSYLFLLKVRHGDNLTIDYKDSFENGFVPPLAVQMLIENAVKHNVISKDSPLSIEIFKNEDHVIVRNNFQPKNQKMVISGIGLENIKSRYSFLSEKQVIITEDKDHYSVSVPILELK